MIPVHSFKIIRWETHCDYIGFDILKKMWVKEKTQSTILIKMPKMLTVPFIGNEDKKRHFTMETHGLSELYPCHKEYVWSH